MHMWPGMRYDTIVMRVAAVESDGGVGGKRVERRKIAEIEDGRGAEKRKGRKY